MVGCIVCQHAHSISLQLARGDILSYQVGMIDFQRKSKREQPVSHALKIWINGIVKPVSAATVFLITKTTF